MNKFLNITIIVLLFTSCQKDEAEISLIGSWESISFIVSTPVDANEDGIKNTDLLKEDNCLSWKFDFFENGALNFRAITPVNEYDYVNNELVVIDTYCDETKLSGTWAINDSSNLLNITLKVPGEEDVILNIVVVIEKNRLTFLNFPLDPDEYLSMEVAFRKL